MSSTVAPTPMRDGPAQAGAAPSPTTVGQYLIDRIASLGVRHVFGIPGDYVLGLYKLMEESPLQHRGDDPRGQCRVRRRRLRPDQRPGLRLRHLLRRRAEHGQQHRRGLRREVAGDRPVAARRACRERARNPLLHHKVKNFETQLEVFEKLTVASAVLDRPETAFSEIDRVLEAALRYKRPVYIELPRDQTHARQVAPHRTAGRAAAERPRRAPRGPRRGRRAPAARRSGR